MDGIQLHASQCHPFSEHNVQTIVLQVMVHIAAGVLTSILLKTLACRQAGALVFVLGSPNRVNVTWPICLWALAWSVLIAQPGIFSA